MKKHIAKIVFTNRENGKKVFQCHINDGEKVNPRAWICCAYYFKSAFSAVVTTCGWEKEGTTDDFLEYVIETINDEEPADSEQMIRLGLID